MIPESGRGSLGSEKTPANSSVGVGLTIALQAPVACPAFTVEVRATSDGAPTVARASGAMPLRRVDSKLDLVAGTYTSEGVNTIACFDLPKGASSLAA